MSKKDDFINRFNNLSSTQQSKYLKLLQSLSDKSIEQFSQTLDISTDALVRILTTQETLFDESYFKK